MNHNILIIDDDLELGRLLKKCVSKENIDAVICPSGPSGLTALSQSEFQLIVLDVMMPGMDGFATLEAIREISSVPVLMLTSRTESGDKVRGLRSGADDYLTKPFDIEEFTARVVSLIRRYTMLNHTADQHQVLSFKGLSMDYETRAVSVNGEPVELVGKEFDILYYCARNQGKILTKQQIYEEVWKEPYAYDDSNIMAIISRLRKKIEQDSSHPTYLQTVKGVGYRFNREV
ncbi:response regulator transcription factor [Paenibacillus macerans]|uniref:response regulator transcription factor n=1 Tax=Paenibacillus macerans TaxID=44252 RepID=UPI0020423FAD|nr:response regulator transcription factor [Paenibacillus macerans]MCM3701911.1 response regulator transcription factor [Paenibacillus macerans]